MADALEALWTDENLRQRHVTRSLKRAELFTWERCAEQVANVYQAIV